MPDEFGRVCSFHTLDVVIEVYDGIQSIDVDSIWRRLVFKVSMKRVSKEVA